MSSPLLVAVLGPTASGKTALAVHLAEQFDGEIVSCDSVAVYRGLEIGTAKPSADERRRAPHHLIDVADLTEVITAGDYARMAREAIASVASRKRLPIVCGGTGLYLRALLEGLFPGPPRSEDLRERLRERGAAHLHGVLRRLDPRAAQSIHPNDVPKMIRAIEVSISARAPMTELWRQGRDALSGFRILKLGLNPDRELLYQRINSRACEMFSRGLVEETKMLIQRYPGARPLASLGYKQAEQYLRGELSLEDAIVGAQQGHRNFAKRQMTWFRREPDVHWFAAFGSDAEAQSECVQFLRSKMASRFPS